MRPRKHPFSINVHGKNTRHHEPIRITPLLVSYAFPLSVVLFFRDYCCSDSLDLLKEALVRQMLSETLLLGCHLR